MAAWKLTVYYEFGKTGWSEVYYKDFAGDPPTTQPSTTFLASLASPRGLGVQLAGTRWTKEGGTRQSTLKRRFLRSGRNIDPSNISDVPSTAAVLNISGASGSSRHLWLRGAADINVKMRQDGTSNPTSSLIQGITRIRSGLLTGSYQIKRKTPITTNPWTKVVQLAQGGFNNQFTKVTYAAIPPIGLIAGDRVYFRFLDKCKFPRLTGSHIVEIGGANEIIINENWEYLAQVFAPERLQVRKEVFEYQDITDASFAFFRSRESGRPFDLSRGRSSGASCRR